MDLAKLPKTRRYDSSIFLEMTPIERVLNRERVP